MWNGLSARMPLPERLQKRLKVCQMNPGGLSERRKQTRFNLRLPVRFEYQDKEEIAHKEDGFTRNISLQGVYVYSESLPPADSEIDIDIYFTSLLEADKNVRWLARAKIIRLEPSAIDERTGGFASVTGYFALFNGVAHHP